METEQEGEEQEQQEEQEQEQQEEQEEEVEELVALPQRRPRAGAKRRTPATPEAASTPPGLSRGRGGRTSKSPTRP